MDEFGCHDAYSIRDWLIARAGGTGTSVVDHGIALYMKEKRKIGTVKQKRRPIKRADVRRAWEKQGKTCDRCKQPAPFDKNMTGDHVTPVNLGGDTTKFLLQAVHRKCNSSKSDNNFIEEMKASGRLGTDLVKGVISS